MQRDAGLPLAARPSLALGPGCTLDFARSELVGADGRPVELRAQALRVLIALGEQAGQVVSKDELMRRVWGDVIVTEDSLVQAVGDIRRALADHDHRRVRTVPRRGYLLVAEPPVDVVAPARESGSGPADEDAPAAPGAPATPVAVAVEGARPPARWWPAALGIALLVGAAGMAAWAARATWRHEEAPPRSLAVMPFESDDGTERWFVDGVAGDLGTTLASWKNVKVVGSGSTAKYRGRDVDPRVVGRELGVRHVLSGLARREGDRMRLSVSLVEARTGHIVWADQRDIPRAELSGWVGDVAGSLARTLVVEYGDAVGAEARTLAPGQVRADDLALQGMAELLRSVSRESWEEASALFASGLAYDADCVRCLGGLVLAQAALVHWEWASDRQVAIAKAEQALSRLKELAPERQLTQMAAWNLALIHHDWGGTAAIADKLAEQYPNEPASHHYRCSSLLRLGRFEDSIAACERALRISPRDSRVSVWQGLIAFNQFLLRRFALAEQAARASVLANPRVPFYGVVLAAALAELDRRDEATAVLRDTAARHPDYRASRIAQYWVADDPPFLAGRDRIAALVVDLGLPR